MVAGVFVAINQVNLIQVQDRSLWDLWPVGIWILCAVLLHVALNRRLPQRDLYILPAMMLLVGWGLNIIDRLAPTFADRQTGWLVISTMAVVSLLYLPLSLDWLRRYQSVWLWGGIVMLATTIRWGVNPSGFGPRLWLGGGVIYYQPSELLKILLVVFLANYCARHWQTLRQENIKLGSLVMPSLRFLIPTLPMFGLSIVILIWQRDLGTASIFFAVFILMLYVASGQWLLLVGGGVLLVLATLASYLAFDVVALRVDVWLNPWADAEGRAFQIVQSLMAVAAGGLTGAGIGQGIPTFIPVAHSDFVFAAIAEEWGLIGVLGLLMALALIIVRGLRIAILNQPRPFAAFLAAGLSLMLATQSLLIMGGTLRLWPLTGVTLPFVSYGGSSLLTSFIAVGLLLIISSHDSRTS